MEKIYEKVKLLSGQILTTSNFNFSFYYFIFDMNW
jgi:hypothetical protein